MTKSIEELRRIRNENTKAWYAKNKDKVRLYQKANRDKYAIASEKYHAKDDVKVKRKEYNKEFYERNLGYCKK
jgi:hypothetical protein